MRTEGLRAALAFFTRLPVGRPDAPGTDQGAGFQGAAGWLPVVGLVVGCLAGAVTAVAGHFLPPFACGVIGSLLSLSHLLPLLLYLFPAFPN